MKTTFLRAAVFALLLFGSCSSLYAQSELRDAHLSGSLLDPSGAAIPEVRVTAHSENSSSAQTWTATSTTDGAYSLTIPPGRYRVRFERSSFLSREFALDLASGESKTLDLRLGIQEASDTVVVTGNTQPLEIDRTPAPVDVITRQTIEQRQLITLPDALLQVPGASFARTGRIGGLATFFLDGGNSDFTKVLVDGTPVNEPGGAFNFSNFTLDNVDKVEVVHGAESALYGTDALAGVVQVLTHRGTTQTPALKLFAEGGSFGSARGGAEISGLIGAFDYSASGSYFQTDGQGPNDSFINRSFAGNFGYSFSDSNQLRLTVRSNSSFAGIPGPILLAPPSFTQFDDLRNLSANLSWDFHTGSHWEHRLMGSDARTLDNNADPATFGNFVDQFNRAGFEELSTYSFQKGAASAGYQYEVENGYPGALFGLHARRNNQAGFLDARWLPMSRIILSAGVRAEDNTSFGTRVVPRAGVVLAVRYARGFWGDTRARISYGQGIKEPAMEESFGTDPCFPGNPSLRPVRSRTVDVGIDQYFGPDRALVSLTYFTNNYRDMITSTPGAPTSTCVFGTAQFFNTDLARARGVNLSTKLRLYKWLTVDGNYSFDDTRVLQAPNATFAAQLPGNHLLRRPVNSGTLFADLAFHRWTIDFGGYFTGRREDANFLAPAIVENPGYAVFNIATRYDIGRGVSFYGRVTNLFDKQYQDSIGYPALGRDFRLGVNYRITGRN